MENKVNEFMSCFCPFGYRDIEEAIQNGEEAGKNIDEIAEMVINFMNDTGTKIDSIDCVYCVFDSLYQEARTEIEYATGKDICNDKPFDGINIYGNYMCTQLDGKPEAFNKLAKLIEKMPEKTKVVEWLYNQIKN